MMRKKKKEKESREHAVVGVNRERDGHLHIERRQCGGRSMD